MKGATIELLLQLYPRRWRERYGGEMADLLSERSGWRVLLDVARAALDERIFDHSGLGGHSMQTTRGNVMTLVRHPGGWLPLALSGCALALLIGYLALNGNGNADSAHDEGGPARLYHLLIGLQLIIIPLFAIYGIRRDWRAGLGVLALQIGAIAASLVPLLILES